MAFSLPEGFLSDGTILSFADTNSPSVFVEVDHVRDIDGIQFDTNMHDTSTQQSTSGGGGFMSQIPGLKKTGDISFEMWVDPTNATQDFKGAQGIGALYLSGAPTTFKLTPGKTAFAARTTSVVGYVKQIKQKQPYDGIWSAQVVIATTGPPTFA